MAGTKMHRYHCLRKVFPFLFTRLEGDFTKVYVVLPSTPGEPRNLHIVSGFIRNLLIRTKYCFNSRITRIALLRIPSVAIGDLKAGAFA